MFRSAYTAYYNDWHYRTVLYNDCLYGMLDESSARMQSAYVIYGNNVTLGHIREFMSCQNGRFEKRVLHYPQVYFGEIRNFAEIVFETLNKDGEMAVCARCFFEKTSDGRTHYRHYLFTTNDPLAADNFNTYRQAITNSKPLGKSVEQGCFCEDKVRLALTGMTKDEIHHEFMTSPFIKADFLREVLGKELTARVPTAEPLDRELDAKQAKAEFEARSAEELKLLRAIVAGMAAVEFFPLYKAWGDSKLHLRTDLPPFKAYKSVGRKVALNKKAMNKWSELAFVAVLSKRWTILMESPIEATLFCTTPDHFTEASKDDRVWAFCLEGKKLGDAWFETKAGRDFMFSGLEQVATQQFYWIKTLRAYCRAGTEEGDELAFKFLTTDTANWQRKLGLTQTLMKELWTGGITFSDRLIRKLKDEFSQYGIELCDFRPPCLVDNELGDDFEVLMNVGGNDMVY